MTATSTDAARVSPIDWGVAVSAARRLVRPGPAVPRSEAAESVARLRAITADAEGHVRSLTGLGHDLPLLDGDVVDRDSWIAAAADSIAALTDGALPARAGGRALAGVLAGTAGVQAGVVLAYLSSRVLGQYDPFAGGTGRLLLVAPNIVAARKSLDVDPVDFDMWVCLHECTHRLQFTAVPWLRGYFREQVASFIGGLDDSADNVLSRFPELLKAARAKPDPTASSGPLGLVELMQSPAQREVFDRLIALSTLLEGHADHVMDAVGPIVVPSVATIRKRFNARRRGGGLFDRVLRALLGVDAKMKQYAVGAKFTTEVVDTVGMSAFNTIWTSPQTLPLRSELADPQAWIRRVAP
ncbi:zinc-dependent metalloprotease [Actinokineospora bangkokensis]|uniref:Coenzyme F420 biosynthesis-associated protein n=1 Tax=Actinokineospora bangkokensis TaxID=1193682 RepID=A0A1Q9LCI9_9PSEU|nr:zinc-dependent metalloprotease [Actinokineospora bangkokensis]OLR89747.1 coenzyme F420 biosynthesis-associated protein [Actinokineospora bangkokensis]